MSAEALPMAPEPTPTASAPAAAVVCRKSRRDAPAPISLLSDPSLPLSRGLVGPVIPTSIRANQSRHAPIGTQTYPEDNSIKCFRKMVIAAFFKI
jgi:hypothetical protein